METLQNNGMEAGPFKTVAGFNQARYGLPRGIGGL